MPRHAAWAVSAQHSFPRTHAAQTPEFAKVRTPKKFINDGFVNTLYDLMDIYNNSSKTGARGTTARTGDSQLTAEELGEKYAKFAST